MKKLYILGLFLFYTTGTIVGQQTPAPKQTTGYCIEGATAHLGSGEIIENSLIQFSNGKITFVGSALTKIARQGKILKANGKHVYPGFIAANTTLGLGEIDAVKATRDEREIGTINPHIRSIIAYNAESKVVESMRPNGVLIAQITPRGGNISGTSSVVQLDAWNWEDAVVKLDDAIHMNWPSAISYSGKYWLGEPRVLKASETYAKNTSKIFNYIIQAKSYIKGKAIEKNLHFEAMRGLFNGSKKLFVHVNGEREITDAVNFCVTEGITMVIVQGKEADKVAPLLVKNKIPVVLKRSHRLPDTEDEDYDLPYRMAKILTDKGVLVGMGMGGSMERMSTRNLPFYAGTCVAFGLTKEKALQIITSNNAKILGIDNHVGSLTVGKDATLFISEGDALDMRTNKISDAFINGRKISLETHQTKLWKRYANKYKNQ